MNSSGMINLLADALKNSPQYGIIRTVRTSDAGNASYKE